MPTNDLTPTLETVLNPVVEPATTAEPQAEPAPSTPSAYQDKSIEEVIAIADEREKSYNELRTLQSRQANELGEVRRMADQLIQADVRTRTTEVPAPVQEKVELDLDDPDAAASAIQKMVDARVEQALQGVHGQVQSIGRTSFEQQMDQAHPGWREFSSQQKFVDWVGASPVRTENYKQASQGDFAYASEILETYKALHPDAVAATDPAVAAQQQADKVVAATLESGSSAPTAGGAKPVYKRSDILHLRMTDPRKYRAYSSEIDLAYKEGRVKN